MARRLKARRVLGRGLVLNKFMVLGKSGVGKTIYESVMTDSGSQDFGIDIIWN